MSASRDELVRETERTYYEAFRERLRARRIEIGLKHREMALGLGISVDVYKKLESRDNFPLYLVEKLAVLTRDPVDFWVTGRRPTRRFTVVP